MVLSSISWGNGSISERTVNDDESETEDEEKKTNLELKFTKPSHVQVEQTELSEHNLFTHSNLELMISWEVEKRPTAARKESVPEIVGDTFLDAFHAGHEGTKKGLTVPIFIIIGEAGVTIA